MLQRISSRGSTNSNSTTASTEWHAPGTYVFDYLGPGATQPEELELAGIYFILIFSSALKTFD